MLVHPCVHRAGWTGFQYFAFRSFKSFRARERLRLVHGNAVVHLLLPTRDVHRTRKIRGIIMRLLAVVLLAVLTYVQCAQAAVLLETAPPGTSNGGTSVSDMQYLGARFTLEGSYLITGLGGHIKSDVLSDRSVFVALVPVSGPELLPSDPTLGDAIFATSFLAPYNDVGPYPYQVPETVIATNLVLPAGDYGIVFGSGLFGATGVAWMPISGPIQPLPWFFYMNRYSGDYFVSRDEQPIRFVVYGDRLPVSEPATALLLALASLLLYLHSCSHTARKIGGDSDRMLLSWRRRGRE